MKRNIVLVVIFILLTLVTSCDVTLMGDGRSVNEYIFPYVEFTLSEDGTYYTASIVAGAALSEVYIASYVDDFSGSIPVKYFTGFENDEDIVNLKKTVFESSQTEIKLKSLDQAPLLNTLQYENIEEEYTTWKNLPELEHTEDEEFIGWFLVNNPDIQIYNGDVMVPGYTALFPKWGTHTFKEVGAKEATCTEAGWKEYHYCTNKGCGYTTKVEIPALGHDITEHGESEPTCVSEGYSSLCYECTRCGLFFSDSTAETVIDKTTVKMPQIGHTSDENVYHDESDHWMKCSVCGEVYDKVAHTYGDWYPSEEIGYQERECTFCHYVEKAEEKHEWEEVGSTESTCTVHGHTTYYRCTNHDNEFTLSLTPVEIINEKTLHEKTDLELKDHTLGSWKYDTENHWKQCSVCGGLFETEEHEFEYTFTVPGGRNVVVTRKCIVCEASGATSTPGSSAFDISAVFGKIKIVKGTGNSWTLSYYGNCSSCYWTDDSGNRLLDNPDAFTITYTTGTEGAFKVFCYAFDSAGTLSDISFALLTAN